MKAIAVLAAILLFANLASAQDTFHVFPQIADGVASDKTYYKSTFLILPADPTLSVSCTIKFYGLSVTFNPGGSLSGSSINISIPRNGHFPLTTAANQPLRSGYATLTCSQPVFAQVLYSFYAANGVKLSEATVFSSPGSFIFRMIFDKREGARLGLAIANNTDARHLYLLNIDERTEKMIIEAHSSSAEFIDSFLAGATNSTAILTIWSDDLTDFSVIGLKYTGQAFTTIPAN
jgi:hypothetical protein